MAMTIGELSKAMGDGDLTSTDQWATILNLHDVVGAAVVLLEEIHAGTKIGEVEGMPCLIAAALGAAEKRAGVALNDIDRSCLILANDAGGVA